MRDPHDPLPPLPELPAASFYEPLGPDRVRSTVATSGPWTEHAQHGGPPAALLARAVEGLEAGQDRVVGRFTMDLLGPVPVAELEVRATTLRPGRTVALHQAELADERGRVVARAQAWTFPTGAGPGTLGVPLEHGPADGRHEDPPPTWSRGYLDAMEWRWIDGAVTRPGPATVWMRPRVPLVPDEQISPLQRLLCCVDSANGAAAPLDPSEWTFMNTDLTVHLLRPPIGEWVCLQAATFVGNGTLGTATSEVHDEQGLLARSAQALLVVPTG